MAVKKQARNRRTHHQLFFDALLELGGNAQFIGNKALREHLGWNEDRYSRIRTELAAQKKIAPGKGQGGSVMLGKASLAKGRKGRNRRTQVQLFLDALQELGGNAQFIGNKALREHLGWNDKRYVRVRDELMAQKKLAPGKGRGGSVMLGNPLGEKGVSIFISYSHADEILKNDLLKHLDPLRRLHLIDAWHDRKLKPGDEWDRVISSNLEKAQIILLLVSSDFINSKYCYDIELDRALERHDSEEAKVIPIILRPCMWQLTSFAKLQCLPKDARAVSLWSNSDEAMVNIAEGIFQATNGLLGPGPNTGLTS